MREKKGLRSYLITIGGGALVFLLIAAFLGGLRSTTEVVVATGSIPAGARLTTSYLELREIHTADALPGSLTAIEDAEGQVLTIARAPGDQVTADVVGEAATTGIANQLLPGHRAIAVHVNQASGLVGVLRPGDRVSVVAVVDPQTAQVQQQRDYYAVPNSTEEDTEEDVIEDITPREPPAPAAPVTVSGLRVLLVPQLFRYEETLPDEDETGGFAPVRTSLSAQRDSVILLDVPTEPVEIAGIEGVEMSPAALLPLLDAYAKLHLVLEPVENDGASITTGAELGSLYRAMVGWTEPVTITEPAFSLSNAIIVSGTEIVTDTLSGE